MDFGLVNLPGCASRLCGGNQSSEKVSRFCSSKSRAHQIQPSATSCLVCYRPAHPVELWNKKSIRCELSTVSCSLQMWVYHEKMICGKWQSKDISMIHLLQIVMAEFVSINETTPNSEISRNTYQRRQHKWIFRYARQHVRESIDMWQYSSPAVRVSSTNWIVNKHLIWQGPYCIRLEREIFALQM